MARLMRLAVNATDYLSQRPHREFQGIPARWIRLLRRFPSYYRTLYQKYTVDPTQSTLTQIHLEVTNHCNLRCRTCNQPSMPIPSGFMALEDAYATIDQAWDILGKKGVLGFFIRGESLLHKALPNMIQYARNKGFEKILLSSNAMLLTQERCQLLLTSGLKELRISIDAVDDDDFDHLRLGAKLSTIDEHLQYLHRLRQQKKISCRFRLHASLHYKHFLRIPEFVRRWDHIFDIYCFTVALNQGGLFPPEEALSFSGLSFAQSRDYNIPCRILYNYIGINWDLSMSSCCVDYHNQFVVGQLQDGIQKVFQSTPAHTIRHNHIQAQWGPLCDACGFNNILVDWFEDEINDYVRKYRKNFQHPHNDTHFQKFLHQVIAKFEHLAQHPPPPRQNFAP